MKMNFRRGVAAILTAAMVVTCAPSTLVLAETISKDVKWESYQDESTGETKWKVIYVTTDENGSVTYSDPVDATENVVKYGDCTKGEKTVVEYYDPEGITAEIKTESFIQHNPSAERTIDIPATCTTDGYDGYGTYCLDCNQPLSGRYTTIPATGHDVKEEVDKTDAYYVAPTCTTAGRGKVKTYCANECGEYKETTEEKTLPALGHKWDEGTVTKEATCEDGVKTYTCETCGETKTETIKGTGHKLATRKVYTKKPTCKNTGIYHEETYCTECGKITKITADKIEENLDHDYSIPVKTVEAATCTKEGKAIYKCSACGEQKEITIPKTDHVADTPVEANVVAPTCTKDGSHEELIYCKDCKILISHKTVTDKATGHQNTESKEENVKQADCLTAGSKDEVTYCKDCGEEIKRESKVIPASAKHAVAADGSEEAAKYGTWQNPVKENVVKATCTKDGSHDEVVYCSVCKKELYRKTVTDKASAEGHDWKVSKVVTAPTCTEDGKGYYQCSICGEKNPVEKTIKTEGHQWKETGSRTIVKKATCTEAGSYTVDRECTVCGTKEKSGTNSIDIPQLVEGKTKHTEDDYEITYVKKDPTCSEEGVGITACKVCGEAGPEVPILKKEHTWKTEVKNNTFTDCTKDSTYTEVKTCTACKETKEAVKFVEAAKDHAYSADNVEFVFDKDDFTSGTALFKCTNSSQGVSCKDTHSVKFSVDKETAEVIPTKEATCTEEGRGYYEVTATYAGVTATSKTADEVVIPKTDHKAAEAVKENEVLPTHSKDGSFDLVVYCEDCKEELSRETVAVPATGHPAEETTIKVEKPATCTEDGSYKLVIVCKESGKEEELTETVKIPATGHTPAEAVRENEVKATANTNASYDEVVYCSVCGEEISRKTVVVEKKNSAVALSNKTATYNGKAVTSNKAQVTGSTGKVTYTYYSDSACKKVISAPKNAGTYYVKAKVASDVNYKAATSNKAKITINKAAQTLSAKQTKSASYKTLKTKSVTVSTKKGLGKATYSVVVLKAKNKKYVSVNASTGKITIKKGAVKGTYRVKMTYAGDANHKAATTTINVVVK